MCYHSGFQDRRSPRFHRDECRQPRHAMATRRLPQARLSQLLALSPMWFIGGVFAKPVDFGHDVAPILEQHCIRCHQPANKKSGLSLATFADLKANEYVIPGDPDASYLVEVITAGSGERPLMPKEGALLSRQE